MADFGEQNVQCHNDNQYLFQNEKKNDMSFIVMLKPNKSFVCEIDCLIRVILCRKKYSISIFFRKFNLIPFEHRSNLDPS